jgi:hypothetical protein
MTRKHGISRKMDSRASMSDNNILIQKIVGYQTRGEIN